MSLANAIALTCHDLPEERSFEVARLWVEEGGGSTAWIAAGVLHDPRAFGRLLAETVHHGARAYATADQDQRAALDLIVEGFVEAIRVIAPDMVQPAVEVVV